MLALAIFTGIFVIAGVAVFSVGLVSKRDGRSGGRPDTGKLLYIGVLIAVVGIGIGIPAMLLVGNADKTSRDATGGVVLTASQERGRVLFAQNCSTCHTLQASASVGQTGPNLDVMHPPQALILNAIQMGRARGNGNMPAGLVTGGMADEVSSYVSAVAGQGRVAAENQPAPAASGGAPAAALTGKQIFLAGIPSSGALACGSCHALKDAGTMSTTGPNLDAALKADDVAAITEAIVNPNKEVDPQYQKGVMPVNYGTALTKAQLALLVKYIHDAVHAKS